VLEVHAIDARDQGRDGDDGGPRRDPAHNDVLTVGEQRDARVEHRLQPVALDQHLVVHELRVVVDVAEVLAHRRQSRVVAAFRGGKRRQQGVHCPEHLHDLATQEVDAPGRVVRLLWVVAEDGRLDLLDVVLDAGNDGLVVIDDLVEHAPHDRGGSV
jgi:hypothetical protein